MKKLIKNGKIVNVFSCEIETRNILIEDDVIIGVGDYQDNEADEVINANGKYICPGFIDGHIHIESTMLTPYQLSKICLPHGTTGVVCDPHEIANVCGKNGINFMLQDSKNLPMDFYFMIPSCVPATSFDETGFKITAWDIKKYYKNPRVLGLAEVMNYVGVINNDLHVLNKIKDAKKYGKIINGHAPMLLGKDLDKYILSGITDDHECSLFEEAKEKLSKGQRIMIRQGTAARNLDDLLPLFNDKYASRCLLVTDDKNPFDLLNNGHIDDIIRQAVKKGASPIIAIKMATLGVCEAFNLKNKGAIAPGYKADILFLDNLEDINVSYVIKDGKVVYKNKKLMSYSEPKVKKEILEKIQNTFKIKKLEEKDFYVDSKCKSSRVINIVKDQLITNEKIVKLNFNINNGIDLEKDILKIAVCERHHNTGHKTIGYVKGFGLKSGAIASSISHDSHNLIIVGTNEHDMKIAGNAIIEMGGGCVVVRNKKIISRLKLPFAGLMSNESALSVAKSNEQLRKAVTQLGIKNGIDPFMYMSFISLPVIPYLKITSIGLIDVINQQIVDLFDKEN